MYPVYVNHLLDLLCKLIVCFPYEWEVAYVLNLSRFWPIGCVEMGGQVNKKSSLHPCLCIYLKRIFIY